MSLTPEQAAKNLAFFVYGGAKLNEEIYGLSSDELWAQLDPAYQADVLLLVNKWWGRMPKVRKAITPLFQADLDRAREDILDAQEEDRKYWDK